MNNALIWALIAVLWLLAGVVVWQHKDKPPVQNTGWYEPNKLEDNYD
jgi:hypothetical protein